MTSLVGWKGGGGMLPEALIWPAQALFSICVAAVAMDALIQDQRAALSFRAVCALSCALCAMRLIMRLFA